MGITTFVQLNSEKEEQHAWIQKKGLGRRQRLLLHETFEQAKYWILGPQGTRSEKRMSHTKVLGPLN
jgi:hypothetical protein